MLGLRDERILQLRDPSPSRLFDLSNSLTTNPSVAHPGPRPPAQRARHTSRTRTRSSPQPSERALRTRRARSLPTRGYTAAPPVQRRGARVPRQTSAHVDREAPARRPLSSVGVADAWGTAEVRGTPTHHRAPPPPPHTPGARGGRVGVEVGALGSRSHPLGLTRSSFAKDCFLPGAGGL